MCDTRPQGTKTYKDPSQGHTEPQHKLKNQKKNRLVQKQAVYDKEQPPCVQVSRCQQGFPGLPLVNICEGPQSSTSHW